MKIKNEAPSDLIFLSSAGGVLEKPNKGKSFLIEESQEISTEEIMKLGKYILQT